MKKVDAATISLPQRMWSEIWVCACSCSRNSSFCLLPCLEPFRSTFTPLHRYCSKLASEKEKNLHCIADRLCGRTEQLIMHRCSLGRTFFSWMQYWNETGVAWNERLGTAPPFKIKQSALLPKSFCSHSLLHSHAPVRAELFLFSTSLTLKCLEQTTFLFFSHQVLHRGKHLHHVFTCSPNWTVCSANCCIRHWV